MEHAASPLAVPRAKKGRKFLLLLFFIASAVGTAWFLSSFGERVGLERYFSQLKWFQIEAVKIQAEWPLTPSVVKAWLPQLEGKSILLVNGPRLVANLEKRPWVKAVSLKKEFPNRIVISLETKTAHAFAIYHGQMFVLDGEGQVIEKASPTLIQGLDLPIVAFERESDSDNWPKKSVVIMVNSLTRLLGKEFEVSQVALGNFPLFHVFLKSPAVEVIFLMESWESQVNRLKFLLRNPPLAALPPRRIDLTNAKKAIVSSSLSH